MRRLEEETFPIISYLAKSGAIVRQEDQTKIAARLAHIAMVGTLSVEDDAQGISYAERTYLREHLSPPPNWTIFLARADVPPERGQYFHSAGFVARASESSEAAEIGRHAMVTFLLGTLCIHICTNGTVQGYEGLQLVRLWPLQNEEINLVKASLMDRRTIHRMATTMEQRARAQGHVRRKTSPLSR